MKAQSKRLSSPSILRYMVRGDMDVGGICGHLQPATGVVQNLTTHTPSAEQGAELREPGSRRTLRVNRQSPLRNAWEMQLRCGEVPEKGRLVG
jgi:hypothetical protein